MFGKAIFLLLLLSLVIFSVSCDTSGKDEEIQKYFSLEKFDTLRIISPVDVYLSMDSSCSMTITAVPSICEGVHGRIVGNTLILSSDYPYKMFKPSVNKPQIHLKVASLARIDVAEACGIQCDDTLRSADLGLVVMAKYADVNLILNTKTFYYWDYSLSGGLVSVSGRTDVLKLWNFSLMSVDASALLSGIVSCENDARSPCYVRASKELDYRITGEGDIYYFGNPEKVSGDPPASSGRLIKAD